MQTPGDSVPWPGWPAMVTAASCVVYQCLWGYARGRLLTHMGLTSRVTWNIVLACTELTRGVRIWVMLGCVKSHSRFGVFSKTSHFLTHWKPCDNDCFWPYHSLCFYVVCILFLFYLFCIWVLKHEYIWNCAVKMLSWNNVNWNQYLFFVPFTWCLWNKICWWKLVFTVVGHNCRCLVWQTVEASVSPVGVNGLMVMFHTSH